SERSRLATSHLRLIPRLGSLPWRIAARLCAWLWLAAWLVARLRTGLGLAARFVARLHAPRFVARLVPRLHAPGLVTTWLRARLGDARVEAPRLNPAASSRGRRD